MDETAARTRLESMIDPDVDPVLTFDEVDVLLDDARRVDSAGNRPSNVATAASWVAATAYVARDVVQESGRWWRCEVAGTSGATEPEWPDLTGRPVGATQVVDNDVVWVDNGGPWSPTWDLRSAAFEGWMRKAGKAAGRFNFQTDGQSFERGMTHAQCIAMADQYRRRGVGSIPITTP